MTTKTELERIRERLWSIKKLEKLEDYELMADLEALIEQAELRGRKAELEELLKRLTVPKDHIGIVSGGKIRDYLKERLAQLKDKEGSEDEQS